MSSRLESWHGDEVAAKVTTAAKDAIDAATSTAAAHAKATAPRGPTGRLRKYIDSRPAIVVRGEIIGFWGVLDDDQMAFYAWMVEGGTATGAPEQPFLRPAFDAVKNLLARDIRRRFT